MPNILEIGCTWNMVRSVSFLDYIFNGCSLLSLDVSLTREQFEKVVASSSGDPTLVNFNWGSNVYITGQVVSYTGTKVTAAGAYETSLCLMPYGAVDYLQKPELSIGTFSGKIPTVQGRFLTPRQLGSTTLFKGMEIKKTPQATDSIMASFMTWRRAYAQSGFRLMRTEGDGWKYSSAKHRVVYIAFAGGNAKYGTSTPLSTTPVLWGDYDFAKLASSGGNFLSGIKAGTDLQVSFTSGRQALLNSAFSYIPQASSLFQDIAGQLINETFEVTISGRFPMKFPAFAFGSSDAPAQTFRTGNTSTKGIDFGGLWAPPPWDDTAPVVHLRTLYTYSDDGTAGDTGHIAKFLFGRFNPKLFSA